MCGIKYNRLESVRNKRNHLMDYSENSQKVVDIILNKDIMICNRVT